MKQFKGTPGPWSTVQEYSDELTIVDSDGFVIATAERTAILQGWEEKGFSHWGDKGGNKELSQEEQFANACLIATAPELLDALEDALHAYDKHGEHSEWDFARAVIAKARGQSVTND